jgi:YD repeat-containing protein
MKIETHKREGGSKSLYYFDNEGKEIRVEDYDSDENITMVIKRDYNQKGLCCGWEVTDGSGALIKRFVVKFDDDGNEKETLQYDSSDNLEETFLPDE